MSKHKSYRNRCSATVQMKELLGKLLEDDEDMLDLNLRAKAYEADARSSALKRLSMDAGRASNGGAEVRRNSGTMACPFI